MGRCWALHLFWVSTLQIFGRDTMLKLISKVAIIAAFFVSVNANASTAQPLPGSNCADGAGWCDIPKSEMNYNCHYGGYSAVSNNLDNCVSSVGQKYVDGVNDSDPTARLAAKGINPADAGPGRKNFDYYFRYMSGSTLVDNGTRTVTVSYNQSDDEPGCPDKAYPDGILNAENELIECRIKTCSDGFYGDPRITGGHAPVCDRQQPENPPECNISTTIAPMWPSCTVNTESNPYNPICFQTSAGAGGNEYCEANPEDHTNPNGTIEEGCGYLNDIFVCTDDVLTNDSLPDPNYQDTVPDSEVTTTTDKLLKQLDFNNRQGTQQIGDYLRKQTKMLTDKLNKTNSNTGDSGGDGDGDGDGSGGPNVGGWSATDTSQIDFVAYFDTTQVETEITDLQAQIKEASASFGAKLSSKLSFTAGGGGALPCYEPFTISLGGFTTTKQVCLTEYAGPLSTISAAFLLAFTIFCLLYIFRG